MVKIKKGNSSRIQQGDIIKNVEYIENIFESKGVLEISKINFPLIIVLTQDCDLSQDYKYRFGHGNRSNHDKFLFSTIVAPIYNLDHFTEGSHLENIGQKMQQINKFKKGKPTTQFKNLIDNEIPRYHYLEFPDTIPIPPSVIDFKHYFTVNITYLKKIKVYNSVCKISELYREQITLRFANFLSRIGLPDN